MNAVITTFLVILTFVPAFLVTIFSVEVLAAVLRQRAPEEPSWANDPRGALAVLIPAHNEGEAVRPTIEDAQSQRAGDRIIVVADNCTDETATEARIAGAEVIERHDPYRRGKGYALDFGLEYPQHECTAGRHRR